MPRMIPPYISEEVKSAAERKIFSLIKDSKDLGSYVCLHSLGLARHIKKRQGEIDFVLVGNGFVLCLEVKGGKVERKDGVWCFTDRYGRVNKKTEGPFAQCSSAMHSLKARIDMKFQNGCGFIFGYGVLVPDIPFDLDSPEWDPEIVYDVNSSRSPFWEYIKRLEDYWLAKNGKRSIRVSQDDLVEYLRGDFEIVTPLWKQIEDGEEILLRFTQEQFRALDSMDANKRIIFTGSAGTGKTLLAVEKSRRLSAQGKRVLLLCFNKLLGLKLAAEISNAPGKGVVADSIYRYFSRVIREAGLLDQLRRKQATTEDFYGGVFIEVFLQAFQKLGKPKFDAVVLDEGQDLLNMNYLSVLDQITEGGLENGEWAVFLDPGVQARLFNRFSFEAYNYLKSKGVPEYKLSINCRNTLQIATQTQIVSGFPTGIAEAQGAEVEYMPYLRGQDEPLLVVQLLEKLVNEEKVPPRDITILSPRGVGKMSLLVSGVKLPEYLEELTEKSVDTEKATYASVQSFKGLENKIIIYTDLEDLEDKWCESVNYVSMTRARLKLFVFLPEKLRTEYNKRVIEFVNNG